MYKMFYDNVVQALSFLLQYHIDISQTKLYCDNQKVLCRSWLQNQLHDESEKHITILLIHKRFVYLPITHLIQKLQQKINVLRSFLEFFVVYFGNMGEVIENSMSQQDVCSIIYMETSNFSAIENGRQNATALTLKKIA